MGNTATNAETQAAYDAVVTAFKGARGENTPLPEGLGSLDDYLAVIDAHGSNAAAVDAILNGQVSTADGSFGEPEANAPVVTFDWHPLDSDGDPPVEVWNVLTAGEITAAENALAANTLTERMDARQAWELAYAAGSKRRQQAADDAALANDPQAQIDESLRMFGRSQSNYGDAQLLQEAITLGLLSTGGKSDVTAWVLSNQGGELVGDATVARITKLLGMIGPSTRDRSFGFTVTEGKGKQAITHRLDYK